MESEDKLPSEGEHLETNGFKGRQNKILNSTERELSVMALVHLPLEGL